MERSKEKVSSSYPPGGGPVPICSHCRNYPTLSNVTKKKKCEEEKRARGQVVDTPLYRQEIRAVKPSNSGHSEIGTQTHTV